MKDVLIIGGGFAGLAAAVELAKQGAKVRLLEQKPHLGGRARSFRDPTTGVVVDNGQHLFMACYHATRNFLETIGTLDRVQFQSSLSVKFLDSNGRLTSLECPRLPAPWHLLTGVLRSESFTAGEKLEVLKLGRALSSEKNVAARAARQSVAQWLEREGQSEGVRRRFWDLLCIAALNEDPRVASAELFARVLRLALFQSAEDSCIGIARVGLSDCYTQAATDFVSARGGCVETGRSVASLLVENGRCAGAVLTDGENVRAGTIISAVPWTPFTGMLPPDLLRNDPFFTNILSLRPAPIISINFWFDRAITNLEFAGLRGTTIQWLFNKSKILGTADHCISLVLSGAHEHVGRTKEDLEATALKDLAALLPGAGEAKVLHSLTIKERFATFSPAWEIEPLRPASKTPIGGLFLAGDWTATGLPATIEGAVQSGYTAARCALEAG